MQSSEQADKQIRRLDMIGQTIRRTGMNNKVVKQASEQTNQSKLNYIDK